MPKKSILVVDDSQGTREIIKRNLQFSGYRVLTASDAASALKILDDDPVDLVITDYKMPGSSGLDLVRHIHQNLKNTAVMMITGYATVQGAVDALKCGAEEYLSKPFTDEELSAAVSRALRKSVMKSIDDNSDVNDLYEKHGLIGRSKPMLDLYRTIDKISLSSGTVLITGESGTGKELVARAIHYHSSRSPAPFVPINCGAIPENLFDSELFGYVKGAFTGAHDSRAGFLQTAEGGTVFLDEVSEMSPSSQVKLLRVLQENEVYMLGSRKPIHLDVRIIAATNKDLDGLISEGRFREDLFYRLNVILVRVPPLRERESDIPSLVAHFITKYGKKSNRTNPGVSPDAMDILQNYCWPGNIRELENVIQRMLVLNDLDIIDIPDLPEFMRFNARKKDNINKSLDLIEIEHIMNVLDHVNGNKSRAAEILGIDRKTLREKLKLHKH